MLARITLPCVSLDDLMKVAEWRSRQPEILRNPKPLTRKDQEKYLEYLMVEDLKRFSEETHMWGIKDGGRFIGWGGFTHITWGEGHANWAELSFICDPDYEDYEAAFRFYLRSATDLWFSKPYWNGIGLYSITYDLPHRKNHIGILGEYLRETALISKAEIAFLIHQITKDEYKGEHNV